MKIMHVVGARPNYMKIAPLLAQMRAPFGRIPASVGTHRTTLRCQHVGPILRAIRDAKTR